MSLYDNAVESINQEIDEKIQHLNVLRECFVHIKDWVDCIETFIPDADIYPAFYHTGTLNDFNISVTLPVRWKNSGFGILVNMSIKKKDDSYCMVPLGVNLCTYPSKQTVGMHLIKKYNLFDMIELRNQLAEFIEIKNNVSGSCITNITHPIFKEISKFAEFIKSVKDSMTNGSPSIFTVYCDKIKTDRLLDEIIK